MYGMHPVERRRSTVRAAVARALLGTVLVAPGFAGAQQASDEQALQEVVITGSLVQRGGNNTAVSPIVSVSEDSIRESGVANIVDALNQLPGFTVGGNASTGGQDRKSVV